MVAIFKPYKILLKNSSVIVIGYNIKVIGKHSYLKYGSLSSLNNSRQLFLA